MSDTSLTVLPDDIEEMGVGEKGFLIERFGSDCNELQQIRELTQNAIEAIRRAGGKGQIVWDVDEAYQKRTGILKLCIVDNGDGMTLEDMRKYINSLSLSKSRQSIGGNYGIGAKITAVYRNPFGVVYESWSGGAGNAVWMCKAKTGPDDPPKYGLRRFDVGNGHRPDFIELDNTAKPALIKDHGTKVTLLGKSESDDTTRSPLGAMRPSGWVIKYLNTRYFRFPEGIEVHGSELWSTENYHRRRVWGQETYLKEAASLAGTVALEGAKAHWWILGDEKRTKDRNVAEFMASGHTAALYQDELYEMTKAGRESVARLIEFGVYQNHNKVVIYVEPDGLGKLTTSTARTHLMRDDDVLPWDKWSSEFRSKMPDELKKLVEEGVLDDKSKDEERAIRERLRKIGALYEMSRYRPAHGPQELDPSSGAETPVAGPGNEEMVEQTLFPESGGSEDAEASARAPRKKKPSSGAITLEMLLNQRKKGGAKSKKVPTEVYPSVRWTCAQPIFPDDLRRSPKQLEDRAAQYVRTKCMIFANGDFRVYRDVVDLVMKERNLEGPAPEKIVWRVVRHWFAQALMETVMGLEALRASRSAHWDDQDFYRAVSPEALTAVVFQRYAPFVFAKRDVGTLLGSTAPHED